MTEPRLPVRAGERVALFGGSFDPAHDGHRHVADLALERLGVDRVTWLVSPGNPLKDPANHGLEERMASARLKASHPMMDVSDIETRLGVRLTIDLIRRLQEIHPDVRFVWLMGSDNLAGFSRWRSWEEIARLVPIAVVARPGSEDAVRDSDFARAFAGARVDEEQAAGLADRAPPAWVFLRGDLHPASSTDIRAAAKRAR